MSDVTFFYGGWEPLVRIAVVTTLGYLWLVVLVRGTGQRTLSKMTPFDFLITVTLGSAFGRVITARQVAIAEVVVAFVALVALQWVAAWARGRGMWVTRLIDAEPVLLYHQGEFLHGAMHRHRITEDDLLGAVRQQGSGSLEDVDAIVFESSGQFAVITTGQAGDRSAIPPR